MQNHSQHPTLLASRRALLTFAAGLVLCRSIGHAQADDEEALGLEPDNLLAPVTAKYQSLTSYADKGTVETRYQWPGTPLLTEHHRFETAYIAPRHFFFRFDADPASGGDAYVIWCDGGDFQSWWKATGTHTIHENGQGAVAFLTGQSPTKDSANLLAPHIFPKAQLVGPSYRLIVPEPDGTDNLAGQDCHRIKAASRVTGVQTVEHRPTTVWVDDRLGVVRQVYIGPEDGSAADLIDETTHRIEPELDLDLPDSRFTFTPPGG